jgi:S-formylglutathione hydrolase
MAATGHVETKTWHSDALGVDKHVVVYLPAGFDAGKHYPVFYYLNGLGGDETNWVDLGKLDHAADKLGLQAIVVMPDGDNNFYVDSAMPIDHAACMKDGTGLFVPSQPHAWTCVHASKYETYIVHDLVAWVDATYPTIATREGRAIAGLSMGGFGALELAMRHPDEFSAAASHSGVDALLYAGPHPYEAGKAQITDDVSSWGRAVGPIGAWIRGLFGPDIAFWRDHDPAALAQKLAPGQLALYLDCGTEDDFQLDAGAAYLHDLLRARGIDHAYYSGPGRHDFSFWTARVPESLAYLRDHVAKPR